MRLGERKVSKTKKITDHAFVAKEGSRVCGHIKQVAIFGHIIQSSAECCAPKWKHEDNAEEKIYIPSSGEYVTNAVLEQLKAKAKHHERYEEDEPKHPITASIEDGQRQDDEEALARENN